jgi:hypothetical protein
LSLKYVSSSLTVNYIYLTLSFSLFLSFPLSFFLRVIY